MQFVNNGRQSECIGLVDEVLDYNFKNGVDCFNIRLLCMEVFCSGIKALAGHSGSSSSNIDFNDYYYRLGNCWSI